MKRTLIAIGSVACGLALAQGMFTYKDANSVVSARNGLMTLNGKLYHVTLSGSVSLDSQSQGVSLRAERAVGDIAPAARKGDEAKILKATATGGVRIEQRVTGSAGQTTVIESNQAVYQAKGAVGAVTMTGAVKMVSVDSKRRTMVATGTSGTATIDPKAKSSQGLRAATLRGPVTVDILDSESGHTIATGDRLDLNKGVTPATLTLSGKVRVRGQGKSAFTMQQDGKLVILLNGKGEFQGVRLGQ